MTTSTTTNPYTGQTIQSYPHDTELEINEKIAALRARFKEWRQVPVAERVVILRSAIQYFETNREVIATEISEQMGKPLTQANNEVNGFFERANYLLDSAAKNLAPEILPEMDGIVRRIEHCPMGTVLILAAWNYPLMIAVNGVLTALLAGNTAMLKHAQLTLSIGKHFENAFGAIAGHENLVKNIVTSHATIGSVISHSAIDHVVFTGSVQAGHIIYGHTAKQFNQCHLELGGKDGAYVAADADPIKAAESLVDGAMYNAGQSCCGIERVYVHQRVYDAFVAKSAEIIASYKLGNPMDADCDMGPLSSAKAATEMETQVADALSKGAQLIQGGQTERIEAGTFFKPTLLTGVTHDMLVMQEENFGPIMPIMKVSSDDEAIELINDCQYGLTSAVYTNDDRLAEAFAFAAESGTVFRNRCDYLDPALPWTGYKDSGSGSGLSQYGFLGLTRRKSINFRVTL